MKGVEKDMKGEEQMNTLCKVLALIAIGLFSINTVYALWKGPTFYRDTAIDYILANHEELKDLQVPSSWETEISTPDEDSYIIQYIGDDWTVNVTYPNKLNPTHTVEVEYTGKVSFHWEGTIDYDGNVVETDFTVVS